MKTLPQTFTRQGFVHQQISRVGDVAIYERNRIGSTRRHFEVVKISRHNGYEIAGKVIEPAETYPSAEQWGAKGWTCESLGRANSKMRELMPA